jgi:hypothetical protein
MTLFPAEFFSVALLMVVVQLALSPLFVQRAWIHQVRYSREYLCFVHSKSSKVLVGDSTSAVGSTTKATSAMTSWDTDALHTQVVYHLTRSILDLAHASAFRALQDTPPSASQTNATRSPMPRSANTVPQRTYLERCESVLDNLVRLLVRLVRAQQGADLLNERQVLLMLIREPPCSSPRGTATADSLCLFRTVLDACLANDERTAERSRDASGQYVWSQQAIALSSVLVRLPPAWLSRAIGQRRTTSERHFATLNDT